MATYFTCRLKVVALFFVACMSLVDQCFSLPDGTDLVIDEGFRLSYFCKGDITKKGDKFIAIISEYTGDYEMALRATDRLQGRLNSTLFGPNGPKADRAKRFFLCEITRKTGPSSNESKAFGAFVGGWEEKFNINFVGLESTRRYTIKDVESALFRLTFLRPNDVKRPPKK